MNNNLKQQNMYKKKPIEIKKILQTHNILNFDYAIII